MDHTPASLFDAYHQDFLHLIESVKLKVDELRDKQGEQRKAILRRVEIELDEADDIISQLEVEVQGIPVSLRPPYDARLKQSKLDLNRNKKLAKDLHAQAAKTELLGSNRFNVSTSDDPYSDRARLLAGTQALTDGSRRLEETTRIALETESQGADILRDLRQQGETIRSAQETLRTADTSIGRASGTLKSMIFEKKKQAWMFSGIGILAVVVVLFILYFKLFH